MPIGLYFDKIPTKLIPKSNPFGIVQKYTKLTRSNFALKPATKLLAEICLQRKLKGGEIMNCLPGEPPVNILAIEDDPTTADVIAHAFDREGHRLTHALTGAEGLSRLQEQSYSLVVVDEMLPDCAGYVVCQTIKKRDPLLPVVIIGTRSAIEDEIRGLEAGADDYLTKPFDQAELLAHTKSVLRIRATQLFLAQYSQQLQLVNEIGHRITSILDLDRLLSEVIQLTQRAFALECTGVGLLERHTIQWRLGLRNGCSEAQEREFSTKLNDSRLPAPLRGSKPIEVMPDLIRAADSLIAQDAWAITSKIIVPIMHSGGVLGALLACRGSNRYFDDKDRLMLGTLAGQLAVAVVNARLVMAQRRETQIAQVLAQAARSTNQLQSMGEIAQVIVGMITRLAGVAHSAIGLWHKEQGENILHNLHADSGELAEALRGLAARRDAHFLATLFDTREPSVIPLAQGQSRSDKTDAGSGTQELLVAPIPDRDTIQGALFISGKPGYLFDAYDCSLAIGLAHQLAGAAEQHNLWSHLQRERSQLEAVLVSMQSGVFLVDDSGQVAYCNPQLGQIIGTNSATFLGHPYQVLFQQLAARSGNMEKARQELEAAVDQMTTFPVVELTMLQPDFFHLRFRFFPVKDGCGQNIGWGGMASDETDEPERFDRMSDLLSNISHELRTPLAAIKGFVTMLSDGHPYWGEEGQQSYLGSINDSADQLGRLIENVLEMARIDAGVAWLRRRSVGLAALVERAVQATRLLGRGHEFEVSIATDLPELEIDPLRIEQVLRNLLENAVGSSPAGSRVIVRAERQPDEVLISIADSGIGIPQENLIHLFDRFSPLNHMGSGQSRMVSLGLYISRELVVAHGGRIWATSGPGQGTTMYFTLPLECPSPGSSVITVSPNTDRQARQLPATSHTPWDVTTILIVEDDVPTLRVLKANLEMEGFKVLTACRGQVALEMAAHQAFQLVLLDLVLPDRDGFWVCEQLREFSSVPVIIITGKTSEQDKVHGLSVGADDYLIKPFSSKELVARVRAVLRRTQHQSAPEGRTILRFGDLTLDLAHRQAYLREALVNLTPHEYRLLSYMATNSGHVLSHKQLLTEVWGPEYSNDTHYLWVSISRLRRKLEDGPEQPQYIMTDPTVGYHFREC